MSLEERTARILLGINAVEINTVTPFVYTSGIKSPIYTDCRLLISNASARSEIRNYFVEKIKEKIGLDNVDMIAGTASAGIPHATLVADQLNLPMVYVRSERKEHGKGKQIEGKLPENARVLLIEDLVSTGKSSLIAIDAIRKEKGIIEDCIAIFTYDIEGVNKKFYDNEVRLHTLSNINVLLDVAEKEKMITLAEKYAVFDWLRSYGK